MSDRSIPKNHLSSIQEYVELKEGDFIMGELNRMFDHVFKKVENSEAIQSSHEYSGSACSSLNIESNRDKQKLSVLFRR